MVSPARLEDGAVIPLGQLDAIPIEGGDTRIEQPDTGSPHVIKQVQLVLDALLAVSFAALHYSPMGGGGRLVNHVVFHRLTSSQARQAGKQPTTEIYTWR
jgi:hypothetical protein